MSKKSKSPDWEYGYRISNLLPWEVPIVRYRVVRWTTKTVVYLDAVGKEVKDKMVTEGHWWFFTYDAAKRHAQELLYERREKLQKITALLNSSQRDLDNNQIRDVEPIPLPPGPIEV